MSDEARYALMLMRHKQNSMDDIFINLGNQLAANHAALKRELELMTDNTPESKMNTEIEILVQIIRMLQPLKDGERRRIVHTAATYFQFVIPEPDK